MPTPSGAWEPHVPPLQRCLQLSPRAPPSSQCMQARCWMHHIHATLPQQCSVPIPARPHAPLHSQRALQLGVRLHAAQYS